MHAFESFLWPQPRAKWFSAVQGNFFQLINSLWNKKYPQNLWQWLSAARLCLWHPPTRISLRLGLLGRTKTSCHPRYWFPYNQCQIASFSPLRKNRKLQACKIQLLCFIWERNMAVNVVSALFIYCQRLNSWNYILLAYRLSVLNDKYNHVIILIVDLGGGWKLNIAATTTVKSDWVGLCWNRFRPSGCFHHTTDRNSTISSSFLGDALLYIHPLNVCSALKARDTVHPGAPRFITDSKALSHYCTPCAQIDWLPALSIHRSHSLRSLWSCSVIIHAAISLGNFVEMTDCDHRKWFRYLVPEVQTELGRRAFMYLCSEARAKWIWNERAALSWQVEKILKGLEAD